MVNLNPAREAWLISGIPGAGKTTVARDLARRLPRAVHIEGDRLGEWITSGRVDPGQQPAAEAERQIRLNLRTQCLLARTYARAGFVPFLDFPVVSHADRLDLYRRALGRLDFYLVVLNPGKAVALERDVARPEKRVARQPFAEATGSKHADNRCRIRNESRFSGSRRRPTHN